MIRIRKKAIPILLCAVLLLTALGCGWDSTPQYVIATPTPDATVNARWTPSAEEPDATAAQPQGSDAQPDATDGEPTDTPDPEATAESDASASPTPEATPETSLEPGVTPTPDPYLVGRWEFKRVRYKGSEAPAADSNSVIMLWLYANGSAEMNIYEKSEITDPPKNTQGVQWRVNGSTLTLTLYGETIMTLIYDGTYLILEEAVFDDTADIILEKTGSV